MGNFTTQQTTQQTLEQAEPLSDGVTIWGFSLGTGYPWHIELFITLIVIGISYGTKCYLDIWFDKRRKRNIIKQHAAKRPPSDAMKAKLKEK
jgi:hypothetical protein